MPRTPYSPLLRTTTLLAVIAVSALLAWTAFAGTAPEEDDSLANLGYTTTGGAAPGYVGDAACSLCHAEIADSYQSVAMSRAFYRPRADRFIEDFGAGPWVHEASGRHYEMVRSGDDLLFRRWTVDAAGKKTDLFEQSVDWIMGSGNHARVYLYRTPLGELYQLPIAWYTQEKRWGMAPGFDRPDHDGVTRRIRRECMFCHNAYPDVPAGSDLYGSMQTFPKDLPEGLGCQRCHGPGAEHARLALGGTAEPAALRAAIVNPARLETARRNDVCDECHMLPSVSMPGVRRFDSGDDSFRPGQDLATYRVRIDPVVQGQDRSERFEINHHPYRLEQSTCFRASAGALSCLTCHDPHKKVPPAERAAHYRAACLTCHQPDACSLQEMTASLPEALRTVDPGDCVTCHMQSRRPDDVVHVVMTDHRIRRVPLDPATLVAPKQETTPVLIGVDLADPDRAPQGALGEVYRAVAALRSGNASASAVDHLAVSLTKTPGGGKDLIEPWFELARGQLALHRWQDAEATLRGLLARSGGENPPREEQRALAHEWLGLALASAGDAAAGVAELRPLAKAGSERPELWFNLGRIVLGQGHAAEAVPFLQRATELRPNMAPAWLHLGRALARADRTQDAVAALRHCLVIAPDDPRAAAALAALTGTPLPAESGATPPPSGAQSGPRR